MPTSELSDALNPYYAQPRSRPALVSASPALHPAAPEVSPRRTPTISARSTHPHGGGVHAVQELLRFLASTREAQEIERKRRLAWEQEQEAKYRLGQAEMERRMLEMRQEITALKARVASGPSSSSASVEGNAALSRHSQLEYGSLVALSQQPTPSTSPTLSHLSTPGTVGQAATVASVDVVLDSAGGSTRGSYSAPPLLPGTGFVNVKARSPVGSTKGYSTVVTESEAEWYSDGGSPAPEHRVRRKNHHDTRCLTIQHAMRNHLLRMMAVDTDKELPDSHVEGTVFGEDEPVRFVWDKTPRQSVHNGRVKERVLKDLRANRKMYRYVPDREFSKKTLDAAFDQAFVTLRQKFKAQRDESVRRAQRQREEVKSQRARRVSRRKAKLGNRSEARSKMRVFEHVTFDGALQMECMSSEESVVEDEVATVLRVRGFSWRSARLQRFFDTLDEENAVHMGQQRRGAGRRERLRGAEKEGVPPEGVAGWMISKGWAGRAEEWAESERVGPELDVLGAESE